MPTKERIKEKFLNSNGEEGKLSFLFGTNLRSYKKSNKKNEKHPIFKQKLDFGQRAADFIAYWGGSWHFIITLVSLLVAWMILNTALILFGQWDPYPFILMNLFLSCLAAFQAPIILMSQNRQTERDRADARYDYVVNRKAEREIQEVQKDLDEIKRM